MKWYRAWLGKEGQEDSFSSNTRSLVSFRFALLSFASLRFALLCFASLCFALLFSRGREKPWAVDRSAHVLDAARPRLRTYEASRYAFYLYITLILNYIDSHESLTLRNEKQECQRLIANKIDNRDFIFIP